MPMSRNAPVELNRNVAKKEREKKKQKSMLDDHDAIKLYNQITLVPIYEIMPTSFLSNIAYLWCRDFHLRVKNLAVPVKPGKCPL
jgi:hypothetical protein